MPKKKRTGIEGKDKGLYWILGIMVVLVAIFIIAGIYFKGLGTFEYEGLSFTKEKFGDILVYHYYYFFEDKGDVYKYNLYLRNDPRENDVPVEGKIEFQKGKIVYLSVNGTGLTECPMSNMAVAGLSSFLTNNLLQVKGATPDEVEAGKTGLRYVPCSAFPDNPKILIQRGDETKIKRAGNSCYVISINNCEVLEATEKFQVQAILDAKN